MKFNTTGGVSPNPDLDTQQLSVVDSTKPLDLLGREQPGALWLLPMVQDDQEAEKRGSSERKDRRHTTESWPQYVSGDQAPPRWRAFSLAGGATAGGGPRCRRAPPRLGGISMICSR